MGPLTAGVPLVIEFGCGDGDQLGLAKYPAYLGFDVSGTAILQCKERFQSDLTKSSQLTNPYNGEKADLALSLDVVHHSVEDDVFEDYTRMLFEALNRYVIIYASNTDDNRGYEHSHIRHRSFTSWARKNVQNWKLVQHLPNRYPHRGDYRTGSFAGFFILGKT